MNTLVWYEPYLFTEYFYENLHSNKLVSIIVFDIDFVEPSNFDPYLPDKKGQEYKILGGLLNHLHQLADLPYEQIKLGSFGNKEKIALLEGISTEEALIIAHNVKTQFVNAERQGNTNLKTYLSIGIATQPTHFMGFDHFEKTTMEALYLAKREGQESIRIFSDEKMVLKSNYYSRSSLERLSILAKELNCNEATILREALNEVLFKYSMLQETSSEHNKSETQLLYEALEDIKIKYPNIES